MTATTAIATQQESPVQVGETYHFHLPSGDRFIGEVDETNGKYVILRPEFSAWFVEEPAPHTGPAGTYTQFNIDDPRVLIYDAEGELV